MTCNKDINDVVVLLTKKKKETPNKHTLTNKNQHDKYGHTKLFFRPGGSVMSVSDS